MKDNKALIVYYSHSGNTRRLAEIIQRVIGGVLFELKPKKEYPKNYNEVVAIAKIEKEEQIKPELLDNINIKEYDTIFLGTPVWWYTFATPIRTFLEENNFDGKTIIPFCTHGGGGESMTYADMEKTAKGAKVKEGFTSYGNSATVSEVQDWINKVL